MKKSLLRIQQLQPALPLYRLPYFERLAEHFGARHRVHYSPAGLGELTDTTKTRPWQCQLGPIHMLGKAIGWQAGAVQIPLSRGDILVVSGNPRHVSTILVMLKARALGARVIWWSHLRSSTSKTWRQRLRVWPMALSHVLLFYTDAEVEEYRASPRGRKDRRPIRALNNGLDTASISALAVPYDTSLRKNALLFIGRVQPKAHLELAIDALGILLAEGLELPQLHIVGSGPCTKILQARAAERGVADAIVWHGALVDEAKIAAVANRCRAFVYPGEVGLSLVHAMAYGLPVVVHGDTRQHMPEIAAFTDGLTGRTFSHGDASSLARAITKTITELPMLPRWSAAARAAIEISFNTDDMAKRFIALIAELEAQ